MRQLSFETCISSLHCGCLPVTDDDQLLVGVQGLARNAAVIGHARW